MSPTTLPIDSATPEQIAERIQALRAIFDNHKSFADRDLKRFLIARQYDVEKAKAMLDNYVAWRAENKADELPEYDGKETPYLMSTRKLHGIRKSSIISIKYNQFAKLHISADVNYDPNAPNVRPDIAKFYPATGGAAVHGYDKKGRPIYIERLGGCK
jgi:hypothetical protein